MEGPLIVASNHPSAFLEASVLATSLGRHVHFLVRGDMFNPKFQWLFDWTKQIPIYRQKDGIQNLRKNASSFDLSYRKLSEGNAILIFPEAKTVLEKKLRPIQRGTAHLAFGTTNYLKDGDYIQMLPVGVNFTEPRVAGTDVIVHYGSSYKAPKASREDREAIDDFTSHLESAMKPLVVSIEDASKEKWYEAALSLFFMNHYSPSEEGTAAVNAHKIEKLINEGSSISVLQEYTHALKKTLPEAIFYPKLVSSSLLIVTLGAIFKFLWLITGGWVWYLIRTVVFSKIKTPTFQTPTAIGAAMVVYALLFLVNLVLLFTGVLPILCFVLWPIMMFAGKLTPAPITSYFKAMTLAPSARKKFVQQQDEILKWLKDL